MGGDDESSAGTCGNVAVVASVLADKSRTYTAKVFLTHENISASLRAFQARNTRFRVRAWPGRRVIYRHCSRNDNAISGSGGRKIQAKFTPATAGHNNFSEIYKQYVYVSRHFRFCAWLF